MQLKGKKALITGGAKRLGYYTALALAKEGADIILHYNTSIKAAENVLKKLESLGSEVRLVQQDFSKLDNYQDFLEDVHSTAGNIDILINSASIFERDTAEEASYESLDRNMTVNAYIPFLLTQALYKVIKQNPEEGTKEQPEVNPPDSEVHESVKSYKTEIVTEAAYGAGSSGNTRAAVINFLDTRIASDDSAHFSYHASKRLFHTLTKQAALKFAPELRVNAIAPGLILPPVGEGVEYLKKRTHWNILNTYGNEKDITDAVVFLLKSRFISGQVLYVDGGQHLKGALYGNA